MTVELQLYRQATASVAATEAVAAGADSGHPAAAMAAGAGGLPAASATAAAAAWDKAFAPSPRTAASFLVNALYLLGRHRILAWEENPALPGEAWWRGAAAELERQGHSVVIAGPGQPEKVRRGRFERVMALSRAFGQGTDRENLEWLRALRGSMQPGGWLCFHVMDRDRAWGMVGRSLDGPGRWREVDFDPATGRLSLRLRALAGEASPWTPASAVSLRVYNLSEIRALLAQAGLALERAYGDWEAAGIGRGATEGRLIIVASRPRRRKGGGP